MSDLTDLISTKPTTLKGLDLSKYSTEDLVSLYMWMALENKNNEMKGKTDELKTQQVTTEKINKLLAKLSEIQKDADNTGAIDDGLKQHPELLKEINDLLKDTGMAVFSQATYTYTQKDLQRDVASQTLGKFSDHDLRWMFLGKSDTQPLSAGDRQKILDKMAGLDLSKQTVLNVMSDKMFSEVKIDGVKQKFTDVGALDFKRAFEQGMRDGSAQHPTLPETYTGSIIRPSTTNGELGGAIKEVEGELQKRGIDTQKLMSDLSTIIQELSAIANAATAMQEKMSEAGSNAANKMG